MARQYVIVVPNIKSDPARGPATWATPKVPFHNGDVAGNGNNMSIKCGGFFVVSP